MKHLLYFLLFLSPYLSTLSQDSIQKEFSITYDFVSKGTTEKVTFTCAIPKSIEGVQEVNSIDFSLEPDTIFINGDNRYARFSIQNLKKKKATLEIDVDIILMNRDITSSKQSPIFSEIDQDFLKEEKFIDYNSKSIQKLANELHDQDSIQMASNIYNYLVTNIEYSGYESDSKGASLALKTKSGDCTEFSDLFIALCRANGIPTKKYQE